MRQAKVWLPVDARPLCASAPTVIVTPPNEVEWWDLMRVLIALLVLLPGCAMSEQSFHRFASETSARNDRRHQEAVDDLRRRGYELIDDLDAKIAMLDAPEAAHCRKVTYHADRFGDDPVKATEPLKIQIIEPTRGSDAARKPTRVTALTGKVCAFFRRRADVLPVVNEDGSAASIRHQARRELARSQSGEIVLVEVRRRVIETRKVLVKRHCDHMPHPEPGPFDHASFVPVLWGSAPKLRSVVMDVDVEEIEAKCTENTY